MRRPAIALVLTFMPLGASAQDGGNTEIMSRALAAGYKAAFTCSATFTAGQTLPEIQANELSRIYPDYRDVFAALPDAVINERDRSVSVTYEGAGEPRRAIWRPGFGCSQLPIGAAADRAAYLYGFEDWPRAPETDTASAIGAGVNLSFPVHVQSALQMPVSFAFDGETYGKGTATSAVVVARGGEVVAERYGRGIDATTPQRTWSVAKSITATIIGAAIRDGLIGLDSVALVDAWNSGADPRREITLENLLQMASGRDSGISGSRTDRIYFGGARVVDEAASPPMEVAPGTRFKYANNDTLMAMRALRAAIDDDPRYHAYPYDGVLHRIGATHTTLETDWNGDFIASSQVWTTARDLARIGELYLTDGVWAGERLLPEGWTEYVSTPGPAQPEDSPFGYGAQFWLMGELPGIPQDTFAAMGHRGQYLVIIPSRDLVIVRRGYDESGGTRFDIAEFTRDVVRAVASGDQARRAEMEAERAEDAEANAQE